MRGSQHRCHGGLANARAPRHARHRCMRASGQL